MAIFKGKNIAIEILGESHAEKMTAIVKGFPSFKYDAEKLNAFTSRRKASSSAFSTPRIESDVPNFIGLNDETITDNFTVEIKNENVKSKDYGELYAKPRPSHADYAWFKKDGVFDFSGGGRFSARLTAPFAVVGGLAKQYLESKNVYIGAYLQAVGEVQGNSYRVKEPSYSELLAMSSGFPSLDKKEEMLAKINEAKSRGDSVGGVVECIVYGLPAGVGDNLFEGLEGKISSLIYSIPAVKGVEFGSGFELACAYGSIANDELYYEDNDIKLKTNNNGGINGGVSNGFNLTMRVAFKPTPSISIKQNTIDLIKKENTQIEIKGRHDACVAVRAVPLVESAVAIALLDEML